MSGVAGHPGDVAAQAGRRIDARALSLAGLLVFVVASVLLVTATGIPVSREVVSLWLLTGLLLVSLADLRGWARGVIFDWLPFITALFAYDLLRGFVGNNPLFEPHVTPQIDFDRWLFSDSIPTVALQERFYDAGQLAWYDLAAWAVYLTHFFAAFAIAAVLWRVARPLFLDFRAMLLSLTFVIFITYALYPAAPPWMASEDGVIGPVTRVVGGVWDHLGASPASALFDRGSSFVNPVAAIPSMHTAYPVLILCFFWSRGGWLRWTCLAYALAMSLVLVYTGEHYVIDVILGWIYAIATFLVVGLIRARLGLRAKERAAREAGPTSPDPVPSASY